MDEMKFSIKNKSANLTTTVSGLWHLDSIRRTSLSWQLVMQFYALKMPKYAFALEMHKKSKLRSVDPYIP